MWWWTAAALASDGTDGVLLPGAGELGATASIGVTGVAGGIVFDSTTTAVGLEASVGLSKRVALIGFGGVLRRRSLTGLAPATVPRALVALRVVAIDAENIRLAPLLTVSAGGAEPIGGSIGLGVAVEGGAERLRFDATVPSLLAVSAAVRAGEYGLAPTIASTTGEVGMTGLLGDHHELRLGLPWLGTWRYRSDHVYVEAAATFLIVAAAASVEVGARF